MDYKRLIVRGISYSRMQAGAYALLLENEESKLKIPVVIGNFEAQSISLGLEKDIHPPRPLTHDLFSKFVTAVDYRLESVIIYQIVDGIFFSNINFKNKTNGEELIMDARTSDAVAMAVRFDAPIFTTQQVLDEAGMLLELEEVPHEQQEMKPSKESLGALSTDELKSLLDEFVKEEDYDSAAEIQEELKKRKKKID
ncbi:MAG: bifunctional nuclease family protein [Flavobacteriaceae bacterium]|jgi:bifunctional DNase/RNase|nr:bifunctional nuclease family protein [Flavobacteriaceae bacterium]